MEKLCWISNIKNTKSVFSKQTYGNIKLTYLVCKMQQLNASYRRFTEICEQDGTQHILCLKRIPHFTTLQKFVQRTPKQLFEKLVKACRKLLNLKNVEASIDGTGFSNTNPSHHYLKRIDGVTVKNYTKTMFLTDNKTKLILNVKTTSDRKHETLFLKPMVREVASSLKTLLADRGYDAQSNRIFCRERGIEVHIPKRKWQKTSRQEGNYPSKRTKEEQLFNEEKYKMRALVESVNSAVKQTLGGFVRARSASQQQKQVTLKALTYNIEHIGRNIKIVFLLTFQ